MNISESLDRLLEAEDVFGKTFYDVFLNDYPEVQSHFAGINMERQAVLLTMALIVVEQYFEGRNVATREYLRYMGTKHYDRNIPRELYPLWKSAMLSALARFHGDDWSEPLGAQWGQAIDAAIEAMFEGYDKRYHV